MLCENAMKTLRILTRYGRSHQSLFRRSSYSLASSRSRHFIELINIAVSQVIVAQFAKRNVGTKLRKSLEELPQGLQLPLEPFVEKQSTKYSPVIDEVLQNQKRFPKCVLLTRVGQFYEVPITSFNLRLITISCTSNKRTK